MPFLSIGQSTMLLLDDRYTWIGVRGGDAANFLQNLLSSDIAQLGEDCMQVGALLNPGGRVEALLALVRTAQGFAAGVHPTLRDGLMKRLRMFVFRADVTIEPLSDWSTAGALDKPTDAGTIDLSNLPTERTPQGYVAHWPGARQLHFGPGVSAATETSIPWVRLDLEQGIPWISAAAQGQFVAHMLNLDWLHVVRFDKGCYPGQEIVARTRYLGRASRRLRCFASATLVGGDGRLAAPEAPDRILGEVLEESPLSDGRAIGLAVVHKNAPVALVHAGGTATVTTRQPPYAPSGALAEV